MEKPTDRNIPAQRVSLTACRDPFSTRHELSEFPEGETLTDALRHANIPESAWHRTAVSINGIRVNRDFWHVVRPKSGTVVVARVTPGDNDTLRSVALVAVTVVAISTGNWWAANGVAIPGLSLATTGTIVSASIAVIGALAVNALIPVEVPDTYSETQRPTYGIAGSRNQYSPFGAVPMVMGTHRVYPPHGAKPYTEIVGQDQYLRQLFVIGHKKLNITGLKIGETDLNTFADVEYQIVCGGSTDTHAAISLYPGQVDEVTVNTKLEGPDTWVEFTTELQADEFSIDFTAPAGLLRIDKSGDRWPLSVTSNIQFRAVGGFWAAIELLTLTGDTAGNVVRKGYRYKFPTRGQYEVRVNRTTYDQTATSDPVLNDDVYVTAFRSIKNESPVSHTNAALIAIRIRASEQLNGVVDTFNCVAASVLPDWNGASWPEAQTNNPASIFRAVLQGVGNARAIADSRIDLSALADWHEECDTEGRAYNYVHDYTMTVWEALKQVARAGRARPTQIDGLWTVVRDVAQSTPVQVFTPRNSWGFTGAKNYRVMPHGWRFRFINEQQGWQSDERIIYDDGYDAGNATLFETIGIAGVTHPDQVWKEGRYHLAVARLRPETFTFQCDWENLACTQGDLIHVAHDAILVGLGAGRIKSLQTSGGNITHIATDAKFDTAAGTTYVLRVRKATGAQVQLVVVNPGTGSFSTFQLVTPVAISGGPAVGDLALFGVQDLESMPMIVDSIIPGPDLTATIRCFPYNAAIYTADTGPIPDYESYITPPVGSLVPVITSIQSDEWVMIKAADGTLQPRIVVSFGFAGNREGVANIEMQFRSLGATAWITLPLIPWYASDADILAVLEGSTYEIRARYILDGGSPGAYTAAVQHTVVGKTSPPPDVTSFTVFRQADGTRQFSWFMAAVPPDLAGYQIRYKLGIDEPLAAWEALSPLHAGLLTYSPYETNLLAAGTYTVAIKAFDTSGNESVNAYYITSTIGDPRMANALVMDDVHSAHYPGTKSGCWYDPSSGNLIPMSDDTWAAHSGQTWAGWTAWNRDPSTMVYEGTSNAAVDYYDLGAVITFQPQVTVETVGGTGSITIEARYKNNLTDAWTDYAEITAAAVSTRYVQIRTTITNPPVMGVNRYQVLFSADTIDEYHNDVNTATLQSKLLGEFYPTHLAGNAVLPVRNDFAVITRVEVAIQGVGPYATWRLVDKNPEDGPWIVLYDGNDLTDFVIDYYIVGVTGDPVVIPPPSGTDDVLLLEDGVSKLLLENGTDRILLEDA